MASPEKKPVSAVTIVIDLALTAVAFAIFYWLVNSHVPSNDPKMVIEGNIRMRTRACPQLSQTTAAARWMAPRKWTARLS